jgi:hypothetical protein
METWAALSCLFHYNIAHCCTRIAAPSFNGSETAAPGFSIEAPVFFKAMPGPLVCPAGLEPARMRDRDFSGSMADW